MKHLKQTSLESRLHGASKQIKVCPVCESVNSVDQVECFVCSWQGEFIRDEVAVYAALNELILRCPSYHDDEEVDREPAQSYSLSQRLQLMIARLKGHRPFDASA